MLIRISFALTFFALNVSFAFSQTSVVDLAEKQQWDLLEQRLESDSSANESQGDGMMALHWAAYHNHADTVKQLLLAEAKVDAKNSYDVTPLSLACERGHAGIVKLLVEAKADVEAQRLGRETPLMLAARNGNVNVVRVLIDAGAKVDKKEVKGQTALMWASAAGNVGAVDALIDGGADLDIALSKSGFTAFMFAARHGKTEVIERLLKAGVDVNSVMETTKTGGRNPRKKMSAIMLAIESGHLELALKLVAHGADPNDQRSGYAPLHAITWVRKTQRGDNPAGDPAPRITGSVNSLEFVRLLVKAGAKVNLRVSEGGPKANKITPKGITPFLLASRTADIPLMKLLLELGADPKIANTDGCTPLMAAAGVGVVAVGEEPGTEDEVDEAIRMLVELGLDPNAVDANGETAMHGAAYRNFPSAVRVLAESGADPVIWNKKNKYGWTPHLIASGQRPGSVKPSPATKSALDWAMARTKEGN